MRYIDIEAPLTGLTGKPLLAALKAQLSDAKETATIVAEIAQVTKELTDLRIVPVTSRTPAPSAPKPKPTPEEIQALRMTMPEHPAEGLLMPRKPTGNPTGRPKKIQDAQLDPAVINTASPAPAPAEILAQKIATVEAKILKSPVARLDLSKMLDGYKNEDLKQLRADLAEAKDRIVYDTRLEAATALIMSYEEQIKDLETEVATLEDDVAKAAEEKTEYLAQCPSCVTLQKEVDRTREPAASWKARVEQLAAEAEAARLQEQQNEKKRARYTVLKPLVEAINLKYSKQEKYSAWSDEMRRGITEPQRRMFAQMEVDDDATVAEFSALMQELKQAIEQADSRTASWAWGNAEMMAEAEAEVAQELHSEVETARETARRRRETPDPAPRSIRSSFKSG
jgi:DNA repair exonuclease SbcCD ATPase subunit